MSSIASVGDEPPEERPGVPARPGAPGNPAGAAASAAERFRAATRARAEQRAGDLSRSTRHVEHLTALIAGATRARLLRHDTFVRLLLTAAGHTGPAPGPDGCPPEIGPEDHAAATGLLAETEIVTALAGWTDLTVPQVEREVASALTLQASLPRVLRAAWDGRLHDQHLDTILRATTGLEDDQLRRLDEFAAGLAGTALSSFQRTVRAHAARLRQETQPDVAKTIAEQRTVSIRPCPDGSATLWVNGPAPEVHALYSRLNACARQIRRGGAGDGDGGDDDSDTTDGADGTEIRDPRTLAQLRFDLLVDALVDGRSPEHLPAQARVAVTVPLLTAIGAANLPGELDGFAPLDAETARDLAGRVPTWTRILTDPADGQLLPASAQYRIPAALRDHVRRRNRRCTAPGCTKRATDCETDHIIPFDHPPHGRDGPPGGDGSPPGKIRPLRGGRTEISNLHPLCTRHHQAKTEGRLAVRRTTDDTGHPVLRWTLPGSAGHLDVLDDTDTAHAEQVRILTEHQRRRAPRSETDPPPF